MSKKEEFGKDYEGEVLWWSDTLGYGFLQSKDFGQNIFVHYTRIMTDENFKTLSKGQLVVFSVAEVKKKDNVKLQAVNVREKKVLKAESVSLSVTI